MAVSECYVSLNTSFLCVCMFIFFLCNLNRIVDADGEFLLVEAADTLPRWANPETCVNRVRAISKHGRLNYN